MNFYCLARCYLYNHANPDDTELPKGNADSAEGGVNSDPGWLPRVPQ